MDRRMFLSKAGLAAGLIACGATAWAAPEKEAQVGPGEDLMREHGVLRRVMLVYDESIRRAESGAALDPAVVSAAALMVRRVIENYHEKLEEQFLFPRLEKVGKLTELVAVLRRQHQAGRRVTDAVVELAKHGIHDAADRRGLANALGAFNRMYRAHAAREDTVLFPAFHDLVGERAYAELGEQFEDLERKMLGKGGFEKAVAEVAKLEEALGIHDLSRLTP